MQHELQARRERDALVEALKAIADYAPIPMNGESVCIYCQGQWDDHRIRSKTGTIAGDVCEWVAANELLVELSAARAALPEEGSDDE